MNKKGLFICFEGADGVGKSTIINKIVPILMEQNSFADYVYFHWKPIKKEMCINHIPSSPSQDPRGKNPRNLLLSLVFLSYHYLCYLHGYFFILKPQINQKRLIIADRYTYDIYLDPKRFRLNLPKWILRAFVKILPQPDITIALTASPETIISRKPELSVDEIEQYQTNLVKSSIVKHLVIQNADGAPDEIVKDIFNKLNSIGISTN